MSLVSLIEVAPPVNTNTLKLFAALIAVILPLPAFSVTVCPAALIAPLMVIAPPVVVIPNAPLVASMLLAKLIAPLVCAASVAADIAETAPL